MALPLRIHPLLNLCKYVVPLSFFLHTCADFQVSCKVFIYQSFPLALVDACKWVDLCLLFANNWGVPLCTPFYSRYPFLFFSNARDFSLFKFPMFKVPYVRYCSPGGLFTIFLRCALREHCLIVEGRGDTPKVICEVC